MSTKRKAEDEVHANGITPVKDENGVAPSDDDDSPAPIHLENAFDPAELLGCDPAGWQGLLQGLAVGLPVQMHVEPTEINNKQACPVFQRAMALLKSKPELVDQLQVEKARLKFRLSGKGKFVHRNRYRRRNIICCLRGEQWWLFVKALTTDDKGVQIADKYLDAITNDNWNGFRSQRFPSTLTLEQMKDIAAAQPKNVETKVCLLKAGDIMTFDGRWWHATLYDDPVLNMFFTPGKDMEVAVKEHKRRMAMPQQAGLKMATINMAKCAKLSSDWQKSRDGQSVDWKKLEQDAKNAAESTAESTAA